MTREEYEEFYTEWCNSQMSGDAFALVANNYIFNLELAIKTLTYNNEAQETIIRDKTAFMEAMTQPKSCSNCKYSRNVVIEKSGYCSWNCDNSPFIDSTMEGKEEFESYNCSGWVNVFEKVQQ